MSRIGKQPIEIPEKTEVTVADNAVRVRGPAGELARSLRPEVNVEIKAGAVHVTPARNSKISRALWGTYASLIKNMVKGVNEAFAKKLVVEGVGYRVAQSGTNVELNVGFSHPVVLAIPEGISVAVEKNEITVTGADKERVGQFAAEIRAVRKPEPYKGKGIRYHDEVVRRKQGKRAVA